MAISLTLLALLFSSLCYGTASVLQARAAEAARYSDRINPGLLFVLVRNTTYLGGLALSAVGFVAQIPALRVLPLFLVQTAQAANLAVTAIVGIPLLGLQLRARDWISIAGVIAGLSLLLISFNAGHRAALGVGFRLALLAWTIFLATVGFAAGKLSGSGRSLTLGSVAGLAFGTVGVAVRTMPSLLLVNLIRDPAFYALLGSGYMAFLFYAAALQRGLVTSTTAALLIAQIVGPTLVGALVLGDQAKSGYGLPAAIGATIALSAAVSLARFGRVSDHRTTPLR
jgi:hypothetical protein